MPLFVSLILITVIAYLWGSIPTGYWIGKILRGRDFDIRDYGSKKTGATNVLRTLGKLPALIVVVVDLSKGLGPALLATLVPFFQVDGWGLFLAGIAAFLGHCFPIFIGFKGGRGVLTGGGVVLIASPFAFLISLIVTVVTIATTRYVSLGSILGGLSAIICGFLFFFIGPSFFAHISLPTFLLMLILPALMILFHRDNIGRLLSGTERKLNQKVVDPTTLKGSQV